MQILLKACQRCGGDLFREADEFGTFWLCLQCGFQRDVPCLVPYDTISKSQPQQAAPDVLIVAQAIEVIRSVEKTTARLGLDSLAVASCDEAWRLLTLAGSSAVIVDTWKATTCTWMVAARISQRWPQSLVVLVVPWWSEEEHLARRLGLEVLHKPIRLAKVESMLRRLGQRHNSKTTSTATVRPSPLRSPG